MSSESSSAAIEASELEDWEAPLQEEGEFESAIQYNLQRKKDIESIQLSAELYSSLGPTMISKVKTTSYEIKEEWNEVIKHYASAAKSLYDLKQDLGRGNWRKFLKEDNLLPFPTSVAADLAGVHEDWLKGDSNVDFDLLSAFSSARALKLLSKCSEEERTKVLAAVKSDRNLESEAKIKALIGGKSSAKKAVTPEISKLDEQIKDIEDDDGLSNNQKAGGIAQLKAKRKLQQLKESLQNNVDTRTEVRVKVDTEYQASVKKINEDTNLKTQSAKQNEIDKLLRKEKAKDLQEMIDLLKEAKDELLNL